MVNIGHTAYSYIHSILANKLNDAAKLKLLPSKHHFFPENCDIPVGMANGTIKDNQITASSVFQERDCGPNNARLNKTDNPTSIGAWCPLTKTNEWIQVKFAVNTLVTGVVTQGRSDYRQWVTKFKMQYSENGSYWYTVTANSSLAGEDRVSYYHCTCTKSERSNHYDLYIAQIK